MIPASAVHSFLKFFRSLPKAQRPRYFKLFFLAIVNIVFDLIGLALLYITAMMLVGVENPVVFNNKLSKLFGEASEQLVFFTGFLVFVFVLKSFISFVISKKQAHLAFRIAAEVSSGQFQHFMQRNMMTQKLGTSAQYINNLYTIPNSFADLLILPSIQFFSELVFLMVLLVFLSFYQPAVLLLLCFSIVPVTMLILYANRRRLAQLGREAHEITPKLFESITDAVHGYTDIRLKGREAHFKSRFDHFRDKFSGLRIKTYLRTSVAPIRIMETATVLTLFIIVLFSYFTGQMHGMMALLALFATVAFRALPSINRIIGSFSTFSKMSFIIDMLEEQESFHSQTAEKQDFSLTSSIKLQNGYFAFGQDQLVMDDMNINIRKGEITGIKGASGTGKTTLLNVLLGFYKLERGQLLIDETSIDKVLTSWQRKLAYVEQDAFLLSGSLVENVAFGAEDANEDMVRSCLLKVALLDWAHGMEHGLHTRIGEDGGRISGGQRQRIAIARALYGNAEVFFFDEATNALDDKTKSEVMETIATLKNEGLTIVLASHDQQVLDFADVVYEIRKGKAHVI